MVLKKSVSRNKQTVQCPWGRRVLSLMIPFCGPVNQDDEIACQKPLKLYRLKFMQQIYIPAVQSLKFIFEKSEHLLVQNDSFRTVE